jgi:hypothetical protein
MKLTADINISTVFSDFNKFDHESFEYVDLSESEKQEIVNSLNPKKFRLICDLFPTDSPDDGYSLVITSSHLKKMKLVILNNNDGSFSLSLTAKASVPLRADDVEDSKFTLRAKAFDLYKSTPEEVKVIIEPVDLLDFKVGS